MWGALICVTQQYHIVRCGSRGVVSSKEGGAPSVVGTPLVTAGEMLVNSLSNTEEEVGEHVRGIF